MALRRILLAACLCLCSSPVEAEPHAVPHAVTSVLLLAEAGLVHGQLSPRRRMSMSGRFSSPRRRMSYSSPRRRISYSTPRRRISYSSPRRRTVVVVTPRRRSGVVYMSPRRRRGTLIVVNHVGGGYGGYDYDDDYYRHGGHRTVYVNNGGGDPIGAFIFLVCIGMCICGCYICRGSSQVVVVPEQREPFIPAYAQRAPDVFDFPNPPQGMSPQVMQDYVQALREEYVYNVNNSVGNFMNRPEAQAFGRDNEIFDSVERQIRGANPDNRNDALDQLTRIWQNQLQVQQLPMAQGVPVYPEGGFAPSAPPLSRFPPKPPVDDMMLRGYISALRQEYQQRRQNALGDWLNQNGDALGESMGTLEQTEDMIRGSPAEIDELEQAWGLR